jgi:hypothetical protein
MDQSFETDARLVLQSLAEFSPSLHQGTKETHKPVGHDVFSVPHMPHTFGFRAIHDRSQFEGSTGKIRAMVKLIGPLYQSLNRYSLACLLVRPLLLASGDRWN